MIFFQVYDDFLAAVDASLAAIPAGGYNKGGGAGNKRQNGVGGKSLISGADVPARAARGIAQQISVGQKVLLDISIFSQ